MRIVFMGTPDFAVPALEALLPQHDVVLVVTKPDKPAGRKKKMTSPPVKTIAEAAGIEVIQPNSARTPEFLDAIVQANAEVGVVVAYGKILPAAVLEAFPLGCLNIHGSLLPKYRGAAPIQRAVMNGDAETGVSIMLLDEGMDTGPVLMTKRIPISDKDSAGSIFDSLAPLGASTLLQALAGLSAGTLTAVPQDGAQATHAAMLQKRDGLVDWSLAAQVIAARIRGLDPWPGAFTPYGEGNLKLFGAIVAEGGGAPGSILSYDKSGLILACGEGAICVSEVQAPGKKRMSAYSFANGRRLEAGQSFSPQGLSPQGFSPQGLSPLGPSGGGN
ncbi:MAG: methionyl-tRNA formyltransferase [Kofleriaceae bacterium]|nr:methionyl-tRNA formyltransferase [Kofleriaceae bacterium]